MCIWRAAFGPCPHRAWVVVQSLMEVVWELVVGLPGASGMQVWGLLGTVLGTLGASFGPLGGLLGRLGACLDRLGAILGRLGRLLDLLGPSWAPLSGPTWAVLGLSWGVWTPFWAALEASWDPAGLGGQLG